MAVQPDLEIQLLRSIHRRSDDDESHEWVTLSEACEALLHPRDAEAQSESLSREIDDVADTLENLVARGFVEKQVLGSVFDVPFRLKFSGEADGAATNAPPIDSSAWTGLILRPDQQDELVANIDRAIDCVDGLKLTQEQKAQVRSLLLAARTLSEAPDPPLNIIAQLLGNADRIIGVTGLFIGIAGILLGFVA